MSMSGALLEQDLPFLLCAGSAGKPIDPMTAQRIAELLHVLSEPIRLHLLGLVADGNCADLADLAAALGEPISTVDHHVQALLTALPGRLRPRRQAVLLRDRTGQGHRPARQPLKYFPDVHHPRHLA